MLLPRRPTEAQLQAFLLEQSKLEVTYPGVGITRLGTAHSDPRYRKNFAQKELGTGEKVFEKAVQQMQAWHHFDLHWIVLYPARPKGAPDTTLVVGANHVLLWSMNACRIIYTIDESTDDKRRFGYAYGALPSHVEQGEESFILEWDRASDVVTYQILAYSKSNHPLVALCWPLAVLIQDRFRQQSLAALKKSLSPR